mgnify:CR=1 FL=1
MQLQLSRMLAVVIPHLLIDNNPFRTSLEEVPVFVKMRKIPPYVSNSLTTFQLGEFQDNIYGNSKVSFLDSRIQLLAFDLFSTISIDFRCLGGI